MDTIKYEYKCKYCKDSGWVQIAPRIRGIKVCPYCHKTKPQLPEIVNCNVKENADIIARILAADSADEEYFCVDSNGTLLVDLPIATEKVNRIDLLNTETHAGSMYYLKEREDG